MKMKILVPIIFLVVLVNTVKAQSIKNLKDINNDVYNRFYQSHDSLDYGLMESMHSKKLMRIPAGRNTILNYMEYMEENKRFFEHVKKNNGTLNISLRFSERLNNDSIASERGIYKFTINKNREDEKVYYGKFHVILVKEDNTWKILIDYDSNENNTIGEADFKKAYEMNDFEKF
ncbi:hypothetical protein JW879_10730 [candidate division WOR-3 bacterium]|nr:hypothetical protein [candidate division WOR-3 bacterium]